MMDAVRGLTAAVLNVCAEADWYVSPEQARFFTWCGEYRVLAR
jgi:hypothetical protein